MNKWIEEFAGFSSRNRQTQWRLPRSRRRAPTHSELFLCDINPCRDLRHAQVRDMPCGRDMPAGAIYACGVRYVGGAAALFPL